MSAGPSGVICNRDFCGPVCQIEIRIYLFMGLRQTGAANLSSGTALVRSFCSGAVKGGVVEIDVFLIHLLFTEPQTFTETLEVYDLPLPQEANDVVHVRIVTQTQNVVVGFSGFLFCCAFVRTTFFFSKKF